MGLLSDDLATRLTARVAPYRDAITAARKAGLTWRDLTNVFGCVKPNRLRWAYLHCDKYEAEQVPLPEPKSKQNDVAKAQTATAAGVVQARIARPLPGQEKTLEQNAEALRGMGIEVDE